MLARTMLTAQVLHDEHTMYNALLAIALINIKCVHLLDAPLYAHLLAGPLTADILT